MSIAAASQRLALMKELGLSPILIDMAMGIKIPKAFEFSIDSIYKVYYDGDKPPEDVGPSGFETIVPLWEFDTTITAISKDKEGLLFFEFDIEDSEWETYPIACTEQGFWAYFYEQWVGNLEEERRIWAEEIGVLYADLVEEKFQQISHKTPKEHKHFIHLMTTEIDDLERKRTQG